LKIFLTFGYLDNEYENSHQKKLTQNLIAQDVVFFFHWRFVIGREIIRMGQMSTYLYALVETNFGVKPCTAGLDFFSTILLPLARACVRLGVCGSVFN
jgi:hypothetical protein